MHDIKSNPTSNPTANLAFSNVSSTGAHRARFRGFLIFASIIILAFLAPLINLVKFVSGDRGYQHVLLIPFISIYLIRENRSKLSGSNKTSLFPAIAFACVGAAVIGFILSGVTPRLGADYCALIALSFWSFILAGAFFFFGAETLRQIVFPLAFLVFAIPVPNFIVHGTEILLQHASAEASAWMMSAINLPYFRAENGLEFKLPGIPIRVAEECSGFNSSFVLFIVSLLGGYLFLTSPWRRAFLTIAVIPLAIIRNGFRITTIASLCTYQGPHMIDSPIHHRGGPLFFALSLIPFLGLVWWLRRSERKTRLKR